jgi:hypothetical protein
MLAITLGRNPTSHSCERDTWVAVNGVVGAAAMVGISAAPARFGREQPGIEPHSFTLKPAVVRAVDSRAGHSIWTVAYRSSSKEELIRFVDSDVPGSYRPFVQASWSRPCSGVVGSQVRIAHAHGQPYAIMEGVPGQSGVAADELDWRLCYARLYFDLTEAGPGIKEEPNETRYALGTALGLISQSRTPARVWVRGPAAEVLRAYHRPSWMVDAAGRRGQPALASSVQPIHDLLSRLQSQIILAQVVPFHYRSPSEQPVGGGWPYFVVAIYEDRRVDGPVKILDYSPNVR